MYGVLRDVARNHGYALAIHGSLNRDFDLIAAPWTEDAVSERELIAAFCKAGALYEVPDKPPEDKPHGRVGYQLFPGGARYVDLSILPRFGKRDSDTLASDSPGSGM